MTCVLGSLMGDFDHDILYQLLTYNTFIIHVLFMYSVWSEITNNEWHLNLRQI